MPEFPLAPFDAAADADPKREHDANGHYWAGPKLRGSSLRSFIAKRRTLARDAHLAAERAAAEASRELRQSIPAPAPVRPPRLLRALAWQSAPVRRGRRA